MAFRGTKKNPVHLRAVEEGESLDRPDTQLEKPDWMSSEASGIWDDCHENLWWLGVNDSAKLAVWCELYSEIQDDIKNMTAARITKWSVIGHELGFDPAGRVRLGVDKQPSPTGGYFD